MTISELLAFTGKLIGPARQKSHCFHALLAGIFDVTIQGALQLASFSAAAGIGKEKYGAAFLRPVWMIVAPIPHWRALE